MDYDWVVKIIVRHSIRQITVPDADGTARLAAADADEWAGVCTMILMIRRWTMTRAAQS